MHFHRIPLIVHAAHRALRLKFMFGYPMDLSKYVKALAVLVLSFCYATTVHALETTLAPSPAAACLARAPGKTDKLEYPQEKLERKEGGKVPVVLVFRAPDKAPEVTVNELNSNRELIDLVRDYVAGFRLPCMSKGDAPVTLRQDYVFTPNDGRKVVHTTPTDDADPAREEQLRCMVNIHENTKPFYPEQALQEQAHGKYYVKASFDAADKPPTVTWLASGGNRHLERAVEHFLQDLRLPCYSGGPIEFRVLYHYETYGGEIKVLKDLSLRTFLGAVKEAPGPVFFDLNSMECPFDLRVRYYRPYSENVVSELEKSVPERKPLMDWLSTLTLNLGGADTNELLGDEFTLTVPCGKVDL